jgi:hypothetical protein
VTELDGRFGSFYSKKSAFEYYRKLKDKGYKDVMIRTVSVNQDMADSWEPKNCCRCGAEGTNSLINTTA